MSDEDLRKQFRGVTMKGLWIHTDDGNLVPKDDAAKEQLKENGGFIKSGYYCLFRRDA